MAETDADAGGAGADRARPPEYLAQTPSITDVDRALIELLQQDGRRPFNALAREVGITEKTARRRVNDLVGEGVIHITAVTDPRTLGYRSGALLGLTLDGERAATEIAQEIATLPEVDYVVVSSGRFALWVEVFCADLSQLLRVIDGDVRSVVGVRDVESYPYLSVAYQEATFAVSRDKPSGARGVRPGEIDATDAAIIARLTDDGRQPYLQIAASLGLSEGQVRQRVKRLVESGSVAIIAIVNPMTLGHSTMAWLAIEVGAGQSVQAVADELADLPFITYVAICTGRTDVFAELVCASELELLEILERHVRPMGGIARVETSLYLDLHYRRLRPLTEAGP